LTIKEQQLQVSVRIAQEMISGYYEAAINILEYESVYFGGMYQTTMFYIQEGRNFDAKYTFANGSKAGVHKWLCHTESYNTIFT
jgi:hypothetical protein